MQINRLCKQLIYSFKDESLLKQALTHRSASKTNNERLEFLGDSILGSTIAHALFDKFPDKTEGTLSRLRAYLVSGDTLADIAQELSLGDYLYLGQGELRSGGHRRASILANALEAIFGAIYLDAGFEVTRHVILHVYQTRLQQETLADRLKDPKTTLQEYLQAQQLPLPTYSLIEVVGKDHLQQFKVTCEVSALKQSTEGCADTRRKAEQIAAKKILELLKKHNNTV